MDLFVTICNCFLVLFGLLGGDFPDSGHRTDPGSAPDFRFSEPITGAVPCLSPLYIRCEPRNGRTAYELLPGIWIIKIFVLYLPLMKLRRLHTTHGEGHGIFGVRTGCGVAPHWRDHRFRDVYRHYYHHPCGGRVVYIPSHRRMPIPAQVAGAENRVTAKFSGQHPKLTSSRCSGICAGPDRRWNLDIGRPFLDFRASDHPEVFYKRLGSLKNENSP